MARKKQETAPDDQSGKHVTQRLELLTGVNFTKPGDEDETRVEAGIIDLNILPADFQQELVISGSARIIVA